RTSRRQTHEKTVRFFAPRGQKNGDSIRSLFYWPTGFGVRSSVIAEMRLTMNQQISDSEMEAMKRTLLAAFAFFFLLVIAAFCFTLSHPPANPCPAPTSMSWNQPPCKVSR